MVEGLGVRAGVRRVRAAHVAADLHYYSLLRPLSELAVARQFAKTDRYDAQFSSCNRNFHLLGERPANRWCGVCPKCHFVFLALAPFMSKPRLVGIFGRNLLDDPAQTGGYDALLEYQDHKPFECVGEGRESRAAMAALAHASGMARGRAGRTLRAARSGRNWTPRELRIEPLLVLDDEHGIPAATVGHGCVRISQLDGGKRVALWGWGREGRAAYRAIRSRLPAVAADAVLSTPMKPRRPRALGDALLAIETDATGGALVGVRRGRQVARHQPVPARSRRRRRRARHAFHRRHGAVVRRTRRDARTLCVTGTKGKSTTTALLAHLLRAGGHRTALAGNIGLPLLELLGRASAEFWAIELSSYQTGDVADSGVRPEVAVALNVFPEHLDWHGSRSALRRATSCAC